MHIGFFAMSGIRACDTELLEMGLTLPGFVERSKTIASLPSLGLLTLAGMTPENHSREYIEVPDLSAAPEDLSRFDLADRLREAGVLVVIGGLHVTSLPEEAANHCDAVVIGEGEPVWPQLLRDAERGCLQKYYGRFNADFDLADAPMPAFELLDIENYNRLTVQTSRGCPFHCEFCASSVMLTSKYKQKPIDKVLAEIEKIQSIWPHPFIEFADDNSFVNRGYWKELLNEMRHGPRLRWFTETDLSVAKDEEMLSLMRDAGCAQVLIGFESPVANGLDGLELKTNWKRNMQSRYGDAIQRIQDNGISVNGCFIIGLDGQGPEIFDLVPEFVFETQLHEVQVTILTPFPGTPLHSRLKREGRLTHDGQWNRCTLFDLNFQPQGMSGDVLSKGFRDLVQTLYSDEFTQWRKRKFKQRMREVSLKV